MKLYKNIKNIKNINKRGVKMSGYVYRNSILGLAFRNANFLHIFDGLDPVNVGQVEGAVADFITAVGSLYLKVGRLPTINPQVFFNTAVDFLTIEKDSMESWASEKATPHVDHLLNFYFGLTSLGLRYSRMPTLEDLDKKELQVFRDAARKITATVDESKPGSGFDSILSKPINVHEAFSGLSEADKEVFIASIGQRGFGLGERQLGIAEAYPRHRSVSDCTISSPGSSVTMHSSTTMGDSRVLTPVISRPPLPFHDQHRKGHLPVVTTADTGERQRERTYTDEELAML